MIYNLFPNFHVRHEVFSFYGPRKPDEGADTDRMYNFCWPYTDFGRQSQLLKTLPLLEILFKNMLVPTDGW